MLQKTRLRLAFDKELVVGFDIDDTLADLNVVLVEELNKRGFGVQHGDRTKAKWEPLGIRLVLASGKLRR